MTINAGTLAQQAKAAGLSTGIAANILDQNIRHTQRALNGKHPVPRLQSLVDEWFGDYTDALRIMLTAIEKQPAGTIVLRSFDQADDVAAEISPHWDNWSGSRYNSLIQTVLVLDDLSTVGRGPDTTIMVVENKHWTSDKLITHLAPDVATYAVAHRDAANPTVTLCRQRFDTEPDVEDEYFTDLHVLETIAPAHALDDEEVSNSGLWTTKATTELVNTHGYQVIEEWTLLGHGTPMGLTAVLPADM